MKKIFIRWCDSTSIDKWENLPLNDSRLIVIDTTGYLIEDKKDRVVIAHSVSSANHGFGILSIPKGAIIKRKELK